MGTELLVFLYLARHPAVANSCGRYVARNRCTKMIGAPCVFSIYLDTILRIV
jgi:hypothetical protein